MAHFFSSQDSDTLILDIGSAYAGVALMAERKGRASQMLWYTKRAISFPHEKTDDNNQLAAGLKDALQGALKEATDSIRSTSLKKRFKRPDRIVVLYGFPWYVYKTEYVDQSFGEEHRVTEKYLESMRKYAEENFLNSIPESFLQWFPETNLEILQSKYMETKLNGYPTNSPDGKPASSFNASLFLSAVPEKVNELIRTEVGQYYHTSHIEMYTEPYLLYRALQEINRSVKNTLVINVSGERTELVIVNEGIIRDVYSFGIGENDVVRRVMQDLHLDSQTARSYLNLTTDSKVNLSSKQQNKLDETVHFILTKWYNELKDTLKDVHLLHYWGDRGIVLASGKLSHYFHSAVNAYHNGSIEVLEMTPELVKNGVMFKEGLPFDPFFATVSVGVNIESHNK